MNSAEGDETRERDMLGRKRERDAERDRERAHAEETHMVWQDCKSDT